MTDTSSRNHGFNRHADSRSLNLPSTSHPWTDRRRTVQSTPLRRRRLACLEAGCIALCDLLLRCRLQVGINLGDPVFRGVYHGKEAHEDDLDDVLQRAVEAGCIKFMVTGSDLEESKKAVQLAKDYRM